MSETKFCPICGIKQEDNVFYWSNPSQNMVAPNNAVFTRICKYVPEGKRKLDGCLNIHGELDVVYAYDTDDTNRL